MDSKFVSINVIHKTLRINTFVLSECYGLLIINFKYHTLNVNKAHNQSSNYCRSQICHDIVSVKFYTHVFFDKVNWFLLYFYKNWFSRSIV